MKIGIISDIHGNIEALNAVLKELDNRNIEKIICLGDLIGGAPNSEEVVQKMTEYKDRIVVVQGNREGYVINGLPNKVHDEKHEITPEQRQRFEWHKEQLSKESLEYIQGLPKKTIMEIEGKKIYIAHYPLEENGSFRKHVKEATIQDNEYMFKDIHTDIYLYGHTHEGIYNEKNGKLYINPGALGCPEKTDCAPYGILTIEKEKVEYDQFHIKYDVDKVKNSINEIKFPGYKGVLRRFFGCE